VIYLDTSCLLKLLIEEPESDAVRLAVAGEAEVIISSLAELEAVVQLRARRLAGAYGESRYRAYLAQLNGFRDLDPFRFRSLPGSVFSTALDQARRPHAVYCRPLDRLHLAAMEELGLRRLMTNDGAEATSASALGFEVIRPGH
jgi:predicted nucleic acid-binding protein